jgi:hypothetical protein
LDLGNGQQEEYVSGSNPVDNAKYGVSIPGAASGFSSHVEAKVARFFQMNLKARQGVLYVDYPGGACTTCARTLPGMLPKGVKLWVVGPDGKIYGPGGGTGPYVGTR